MTNVTLLLCYEPDDGRPLVLARLDLGDMINAVARVALEQAQMRAELLARADPNLGLIEHAEAERLQRVLNLLLPNIRLSSQTSSLIQ